MEKPVAVAPGASGEGSGRYRSMPSSVIRSYHYDSRRRALHIVFQSRRRYTYLGVPEKTYDAMKAASSKGEFFNRHIRDHFAFERNGEEPQSGRS